MTLEELQRTYYPDARVIEVTDRVEAQRQIASKTVSCWGAGERIRSTEWVRLAMPSRQRREDKQVVFVCRASLVERAK